METTEELLKKYEELSLKYDNLKEEIYKRTLENEKLIKNLSSIENEFEIIANKLKNIEV